MSYADYEESDYSGQPLELFRFAMGDRLWLYTSGDAVVSKDEDEYQPCYIKRGTFTKGGDAQKSSMEIEVAATNDVAMLFRTGWLSSVMTVTVFRHHYGDSDFSILWKGRVTSCKWSGSVAALTTESVFTLFKRAGLRRVYQVGCPHALYSDACGVNADDYALTTTVTEVSGTDVTLDGISSYGTGYFLGGMIQYGNDLRMITAHSEADTVSIIDAMDGLAEGETVTVWPGCMQTVSACKNKFNNYDNYGGLPFLPADNPFSGDALV